MRLKKLIKIFKDRNLYIFCIITIMFFGIFLKLEYATDTYCVFATNTKQYCEHFLYSGRPLSALFLAATHLLRCSPNSVYTISYLIAIVSTIVSLYILHNVIKKDIKNDILSILISTSVIINLFSIELYLFLEKGVLMLSVLFCTVAFKNFMEFLSKKEKKYIFKTFMYMLFANFSYQGTVGLFIALCSIYIIKNSKKIKDFIENNIIAAICYGIPAFINYLIVKCVFNNSRVSSEFNIGNSIQLILKNTVMMLTETYNIIPKNIFLTVLIILITFALAKTIINNEKSIKKIIKILKLIYVFLAIYCVTVFPQIMQSTSSIGFAPRNTYSFASVIGILVLYIIMISKNKREKIVTYLSICILVIYLIIQYIGFTEIQRNRYILNYNDYYNAMQIIEKVEKYEKLTGNKINKVAVYKQNGITGSYPNLWISGDINIKATTPDWSRLDYLRYYLNRNLEQVDENEKIYDEYFKGKDWKIFDIEQIVLDDDVLHFCMY